MRLFKWFRKKPQAKSKASEEKLTVEIATVGYDKFIEQMAEMENAVESLTIKLVRFNEHAETIGERLAVTHNHYNLVVNTSEVE